MCELAEQENGLIRDLIVLGIKDSGLQEQLLRENNLGLEKAIEIVRAAEVSREQIRNMKYETATVILGKKKENLNQPKKSSQYGWLKCCKELKLIERIDVIEYSKIRKNGLIKQYKDVFTGIGEFPSEPYHMTLKDNSVPVIHPPRHVPQALQPKLKSTLNNLEKERIVSKVNKPTDCVQSLVIVEKPNGNLRLCLDARDLNKVIKREHYQIPCTDDIISRLERKKIFSVVDLKDDFWHASLDEVSSEICTFNTPFGRYKFNKLPFGIVSVPEVFRKRNQKLFGDIECVKICCRI
ncbi:uncharacterized protein K02A2.6 [Nephila pilipes]|uniref:Uncharacterized protein K02A2.6 n=1 Tax=Nephila pilipes TaxID=299642 RepID=A0A8X6MPE9_NEPPI|nr:uncharacterized protein K02A2.6 [Nephila pilipes]